MVTISNDICKVWKIVGNLVGLQVTIPGSIDEEHYEEGVPALAVIDNNC